MKKQIQETLVQYFKRRLKVRSEFMQSNHVEFEGVNLNSTEHLNEWIEEMSRNLTNDILTDLLQ